MVCSLEESRTAELLNTASKLSDQSKGVFGADQLAVSLQGPFTASGISCTAENIQKYRDLLLSAPGIEQHLSCAIVYRQLLEQTGTFARKCLDALRLQGVVIGVKVDGEGLDGLAETCRSLYEEGVRMVTWRAVFKISEHTFPSDAVVLEGATTLAKYAAIAQAAGLVPMLNPEILDDGDHSLEMSRRLHERVLQAVFQECLAHGVLLQAVLLKSSWVRPGVAGPSSSAEIVAQATMEVLGKVVPHEVPFIGLLSGGWSEAEVTAHLSLIQSYKAVSEFPWTLTFTLGRALQASVIETWAGDDFQIKSAQQMLKDLCKVNAQAVSGTYMPSSRHPSIVSRSLHEENYQH